MAGHLSPENSARLDRLFRLYSGRVLAYAASRARRPEDADDIAGAAWVLACRYITGLRADDDQAMGWLASIVRTAVRDYYRPRRASEEPRDWTDAVVSRSLPAAPPADAEPVALSVLTRHQAAVLRMKDRGWSDRRIARRLGRSEAAVWKHKHAAGRRLRLALAG